MAMRFLPLLAILDNKTSCGQSTTYGAVGLREGNINYKGHASQLYPTLSLLFDLRQ
jgi:hypothetical protein